MPVRRAIATGPARRVERAPKVERDGTRVASDAAQSYGAWSKLSHRPGLFGSVGLRNSVIGGADWLAMASTFALSVASACTALADQSEYSTLADLSCGRNFAPAPELVLGIPVTSAKIAACLSCVTWTMPFGGYGLLLQFTIGRELNPDRTYAVGTDGDGGHGLSGVLNWNRTSGWLGQ